MRQYFTLSYERAGFTAAVKLCEIIYSKALLFYIKNNVVVFDASSKLMPGILSGNLAEFGSWNECLNIRAKTDSGIIRGRYCAIFIYPPEQLVRSIVRYHKNFSEQVSFF